MDLCFELASLIMASLGDAVVGGRRGAGIPVFHDNRDLLGFVGRHREPGRAGRGRCRAGRRRRPRICRRQLCDPAEIPARHERLERAADRGAGAHYRPHQARQRRSRPGGEAELGAQRADGHRREWPGDEDRPRQHAVRQSRAGRVRHLFHRLQPARRAPSKQMLEKHVAVRRPPGNYDRILDFSRAVTGHAVLRATAASLLDSVAPAARPIRREMEIAVAVPPADAAPTLSGGVRATARSRSVRSTKETSSNEQAICTANLPRSPRWPGRRSRRKRRAR